MQTAADQTIFGHEENGMMDELESIFRNQHPVHARRQAFFDASQRRGQSFTTFMADLDALAKIAELRTLDTKQLMVYRLLAGCSDHVLRTKILEKSEEPSLDELTATVLAYEAAKNTSKSASANTAGWQQQQQRGKRPLPQRGKPRYQPNGKRRSRSASAHNATALACYRCGSFSHNAPQCKVSYNTVTCKKCNMKGHVASVCNQGKPRKQQQQRGRSMSRNHKGGNRNKSRHQSHSSGRRFANVVEHTHTAAVCINIIFWPCPSLNFGLQLGNTQKKNILKFQEYRTGHI